MIDRNSMWKEKVMERIEEGSAPPSAGTAVLRKGKRERRAVRFGG
jgi:hypothetical protein